MSDERTAPRTSGEMLARAREFLAKKDVPDARLEAELLVAHALGLDRLHLFLALDRPVTDAETARARDLLVRRAKREPTAYLQGFREFYGRRFEVNRDVLIPRPETELVVDHVRAFARELAGQRGAAAESSSAPEPTRPDTGGAASTRGARGLVVGDFGTGSGCLAIVLALELDAARVFAVDVSARALAVARANAERLAADVTLVEAREPRALVAAAGQKLDVLVSNPPYVGRDERESLAPEVRDHEPELALFAPEGDPDHWLRTLVRGARELVVAGGALFVELGHRQGDAALELARTAGLDARVHPDLARIPRVLEARVPRV
ncbi:MAG: peptide chain release factor N(5)-glutamine methyltransferase [Planctomycetes bacterium]|nr:peptide chain release factor N(5)-glutamine methyltransferase [Planctomycetota bacterium]